MSVMLISLKHKQHKTASVTLSIFVGSWLLVLCQTCLADVEYDKPDVKPEACHITISEDVIDDVSAINDEHCPAACDCDAIILTMNSEKKSESKEKIKFSADVFSLVILKFTQSTRAPPAYRIPVPPERAILLPLQNYSILLI